MDKPALMHGFETRSGKEARIDLWQIRSILPCHETEGHNWVRLVLDNGHSVVVEGTVEWAHRLVTNYTTGSRIPAPGPVVGAAADSSYDTVKEEFPTPMASMQVSNDMNVLLSDMIGDLPNCGGKSHQELSDAIRVVAMYAKRRGRQV